jgi:hypothetical protein
LGAGLLILVIALGGGLGIRQHLRSRIVHQTRRGLQSYEDRVIAERAGSPPENSETAHAKAPADPRP